MVWTYKQLISLCLVLGVGVLSGCAMFRETPEPALTYGPREQVFTASFEEVWRAVNLATIAYPLKVNNMDQGMIETDVIRGYQMWSPAHKSDKKSGGASYRLLLRVIRGDYGKKSAVKVSITKDFSQQQDFFSETKKLPSDGLEEKSLLYRVERELTIERALQRAQKKKG